MEEIVTVKQFLDATPHRRGAKHPSKETLKADFERLNVSEDCQIEVLTFFLYDDSDN